MCSSLYKNQYTVFEVNCAVLPAENELVLLMNLLLNLIRFFNLLYRQVSFVHEILEY